MTSFILLLWGEHPTPCPPPIMGNPASGSHHLIKKFPTAKFTVPAPLKAIWKTLFDNPLSLLIWFS